MIEFVSPTTIKAFIVGSNVMIKSKRFMSIANKQLKAMSNSNEAVSSNLGQSYKQFTLVIYDSTVVIWGILKSGTTLES